MKIPILTLLLATSLAAQPPSDLPFGDAFWSHWGDGKAELAGYDLEIRRYGEVRQGIAVAIFVTEPFTVDPRVKADGPNAKTGKVFQVLKLNLVRDFPTGIYDYNTMTSVFVGLEPFAGLPSGSPAKITFSSQEWCGHVWEQAVFDRKAIEVVSHSYFGGEADQSFSIRNDGDLWSEDQLFHWARGLALPSNGDVTVRMLPTFLETRLSHKPVQARQVELRRETARETIEVPAGSFETVVHEVVVDGSADWKFWVETAVPHRIIQWTRQDEERGRLRGSERLPYWKMNGSEYEDAVRRLGL